MVAKELAKYNVKDLPAPATEMDHSDSQESPVEVYPSVLDPLPSPPGAMIAPVPSPATTLVSSALAPAGEPSGTSDDTGAATVMETKDPQPEEHEVLEDELSEKLKTIQLTRPKVQPLKQSRWRSNG